MKDVTVTPPAEDRFERIGTTYYKIVRQPNAAGQLIERSIPWTIEAIRQDYGKDFLANVPKYDGFCCVPSHLDYQPVVGNFKNKYSPLSHIPAEGEWQCIESLVRHIFGEQYELGLDYLQILYTMPLQKLPILLLVSEERNTGKSTFLNFLKLLFEANVTFNTNENFRSQFNDDWNGKLVIVVDEVLLNKREDSERLKNLSTTRNYKMEAKGRDREEVSFFAKFVLCSNNEYLLSPRSHRPRRDTLLGTEDSEAHHRGYYVSGENPLRDTGISPRLDISAAVNRRGKPDVVRPCDD